MTQKIRRLPPGRFMVGSAGSSPGDEIHPLALEVLRKSGIDWGTRRPKGIDEVRDTPWDLIITVCDRARETCPVFASHPIFAHWGMNDPAEETGDETSRRRAFDETLTYLSRRIDLLLALPFESLEESAIELRVQKMAEDVPVPKQEPG